MTSQAKYYWSSRAAKRGDTLPPSNWNSKKKASTWTRFLWGRGYALSKRGAALLMVQWRDFTSAPRSAPSQVRCRTGSVHPP